MLAHWGWRGVSSVHTSKRRRVALTDRTSGKLYSNFKINFLVYFPSPMKSACVWGGAPPFQLIYRLTDFHEIWYKSYANGGYHPNTIIHNFILSAITTWRMRKLVNVGTTLKHLIYGVHFETIMFYFCIIKMTTQRSWEKKNYLVFKLMVITNKPLEIGI
jgi:hypothetical protein